MAVELELPTIHGRGGDYSGSNFTQDGISFDWRSSERSKSDDDVVDPELVQRMVEHVKLELGEEVTPALVESSIRHSHLKDRERRFFGSALREAQEILIDSQTPIEAKARLVGTGHFYLRTYDPGEILSVLGYYGREVDPEPFNWLAVSAREESFGRLAYYIRHINVLIDNVQSNKSST